MYSDQMSEAGSGRGGEDSARSGMDSVDFEFAVLELALTLTIKAIELESCALEAGSKRAMECLQHQVSKGALADIMRVKTSAVKMNTRVLRFKEV